ncbi:MAG TPA: methyltransferase domain-containing protein [Candidatus Acidoferrales bacterium]|nr:methyltransferase domain-containing protein [Candidatus Acidoferrales bacterium]
MPTWNAEQYLKFGDERAQPCRDLIARIALSDPRTIVDLGSGPGNSAAMIAERWPGAEITGIDNSEEMIQTAQKAYPARQWVREDISSWAAKTDGEWDLVFTNASLQWVPDHARVFPQLLARVSPGGAFAVQMPSNLDEPAMWIPREMAASERWRRWFPKGFVDNWSVHGLPFYYDALAPLAARLELWQTRYFHIFADAGAIVEWYKGSGLRPFLDAIQQPRDREKFVSEYLEGLREHYGPQRDGKVLFPFRRIFLIAYRPAR